MGRPRRSVEGGQVYHVLNRASARVRMFDDDADYESFEHVLDAGVERTGTRLLAYCVMPNHWHLVLWPREDGELSRFTGWLTLTHTQRWHARRRTTGSGHLYQGRFKSFPVEGDDHFLTVCRYIERNALRAGLVPCAEHWRWGSLWRYVNGNAKEKSLISSWPVRRSPGWVEHVNVPQTETELAAIRRCVERGRPFGSDAWTKKIIARYGLETTVRPRGRPRNP